MKEFRTLLLVFFSIVAARLLSESSSCQVAFNTVCEVGVMILIPFILTAYFVDSALVEFYEGKNKKRTIVNTLICIPYFVSAAYFIYYFFVTITAVTIEYIISLNLLYMFIVFALIHWINNHEKVRKLNTVFMVTFLLSAFIFQFI